MSIASMIGLNSASKPQPPQPPAKRDPREIHPAAVEAAVKWSQIWDTNDQLAAENTRLRNELEVLDRVDREKDQLISNLRDALTETQHNTDQRVEILEAHYRAELARAEHDKERYLRYAVDLSGRLRSCGEQINGALRSCAEQITSAHHAAMEMARAETIEMPRAKQTGAEEQLPKTPTLAPRDSDQRLQDEIRHTGDGAAVDARD